jgi:hypothetical protein
MAKPNYAFEKRQRDLAKKQKKEEKRLRKKSVNDKPPRGPEPKESGADDDKAES